MRLQNSQIGLSIAHTQTHIDTHTHTQEFNYFWVMVFS